MRTLRRSGAAAMLAAVALAATACGGLGATAGDTAAVAPVPELSPGQHVDITFESYNLATAGTWTNTVNDLIARFQRKHPNITVHGQPPQGGGSAATGTVSSVQSQLMVGKAPDVAQLTFGDLGYVVSKLKPKPLADLVGAAAVQNALGGAHPIHERARNLASMDGKAYGLPYVFSTPVLFYNADLFRKAGLDPAKPPATWAEVQQDALAIKNATGAAGAYADCFTKTAGDWCLQSVVRSNGGAVLSADRKKLTFADGPSADALATMQQMVKSGATPDYTQAQAMDAMGRGQLGMLLESSALQGTLQQQSTGKWELRAAQEPSFGTRPAVPTNSGSGLFVFSQDKAKQRAGWDLITFLTSDEAYTQISSKIGYLPLRTGLVDDPATLKPWADQHPLIKPNLAQLDRLEPWVSLPGDNYVQVRDLMLQAVENVVYRGADAHSTLAAAQARGQELMAK
ncbi:ABC transporter substrate-binding protein [Amycolatopsis rubida]|uniref:Multiple sugar transport system substrate-binding protein n=1 Tax=Amycolatopsis rubida TaxID=112413 RepID=A0A1I5SIH3_9PSEU|nr:ABC transporter substrate-binding protein [Amycolatopsis rubida]SFP70146.1 multiple sugar transport system substrate-binding protein [Amycolatopsis rubida]